VNGAQCAISGRPDHTRFAAGQREQQVLEPIAAPKGRMQLLRWHRVEGSIDPSRPEPSNFDRRERLREYGFSIFVVDETPGTGRR
jgi:hypothetical protein